MEDKIILVKEEPCGPSYLIEVPVTADSQNRIAFPDVPQLRNTMDQTVVIKAIRTVTADVLAKAPIGGQVTAPLAELQKMSLVIYAEGWEKGQYIPALTLNDVATPAGSIPYRFNKTSLANWRNVDWNKSYILYSNGSASAGSPYAFLLQVEYVRLNKKGQEIVGPNA